MVIQIARDWFGFLKRCPGAEVALGDARLVLAGQAPQEFDVLVVDAFTSDSVPVHLLTQEAFTLYRRHLKPGGILALHISNRFLDLEPVVAAAARQEGLSAWYVQDVGVPLEGYFASQWILVTEGRKLPITDTTGVHRAEVRDDLRRWTDDYVNVAAVLD